MSSDQFLIELFNQTKHVRSLQKQYFATKSPAVLVSAKTEESKLDMMLFAAQKRIDAKQKVRG